MFEWTWVNSSWETMRILNTQVKLPNTWVSIEYTRKKLFTCDPVLASIKLEMSCTIYTCVHLPTYHLLTLVWYHSAKHCQHKTLGNQQKSRWQKLNSKLLLKYWWKIVWPKLICTILVLQAIMVPTPLHKKLETTTMHK